MRSDSTWKDVLASAQYRCEAEALALPWAPGCYLFSAPPARNMNAASLEARITALIVGTKEDRFGRTLPQSEVVSLQLQVAEAIREGAPIRTFVMWGALKHYVQDERQGVDVAELFSLIQFARLNDAVRALYAPGLGLDLYVEDFGVIWEDGIDRGEQTLARVEQGVRRYVESLERLIGALRMSWVNPLRFQDAVPLTQHAACSQQAQVNFEHLRAFWQEWSRSPETNPEGLLSFQKLKAIGWAGEVTTSMSTHYLDRLKNLHPDEGRDENAERLLRYFAIVLLYSQRRVFPHHGQPSIKFAMYRPAPGINVSRLSGRVHVRTLPKSLSSCTAPPWTTKGCFVPDSGTLKPALESFRLLAEQKASCAEGALHLDGVVLPADLVLKSGELR